MLRHLTRTLRTGALTAGLAALCACQPAAPRPPDPPPVPRPADATAIPPAAPPPVGRTPAAALPDCVRGRDLPAPPRRVAYRKPEWTDLHKVRTHGGVLVFEITIAPSGRIADVRVVRDVDTQKPWSTIAGLWREAIAEWRYEPPLRDGKPVSVCATVSVTIDVM